jgi:hypothetical protein
VTDIIFRFFDAGTKVYAVDPHYVEENKDEPCTDIRLSFDSAGKFVTGQLVRRNEELTSDGPS